MLLVLSLRPSPKTILNDDDAANKLGRIIKLLSPPRSKNTRHSLIQQRQMHHVKKRSHSSSSPRAYFAKGGRGGGGAKHILFSPKALFFLSSPPLHSFVRGREAYFSPPQKTMSPRSRMNVRWKDWQASLQIGRRRRALLATHHARVIHFPWPTMREK